MNLLEKYCIKLNLYKVGEDEDGFTEGFLEPLIHEDDTINALLEEGNQFRIGRHHSANMMFGSDELFISEYHGLIAMRDGNLIYHNLSRHGSVVISGERTTLLIGEQKALLIPYDCEGDYKAQVRFGELLVDRRKGESFLHKFIIELVLKPNDENESN